MSADLAIPEFDRLRRAGLAAVAFLAVLHVGAEPLDPKNARPYGAGFSLEDDVFVCTAKEVKLRGSTKPQKAAGASWNVVLNQESAAAVRFGAEGVADDLDESASFRVYVDVTYDDGSHQWGLTSSFDSALAAGWHRRDVTIRPRRPISSLSCYLFLRGGFGKVRFRSPTIEVLPADARPLLDGEPVTVGDLPPVAGFLARDVSAHGAWTRIDGTALDCALTVREEMRGDARVVDAVLSGGTAKDRAITLAYAMPLPLGDAVWFDSPRRATRLSPVAEEQAAILNLSCGRGLSCWPFGAVGIGEKGFAIGIDPDFPAMYRVVASPRTGRLFIAFDIGLAPENASAHVRFAVFQFAARDGFRGALERYQALYPEAYKVRTPRQGNWMAFHSISNLPHHEDFGFRFKEGERERDWDDAHGIYTFHYEEPCTWWMKLGKVGEGSVKMTRADCVAKVESLAAKGDAMALEWKACAVRDAHGLPYGEIRDTPWCNGVVWAKNCAPGIIGTHTEFGRKWSGKALAARYGEAVPFPGGLDGEFLDSSNLPVTCPFDFDRAHFAAMRTPLTFTPGAVPRVGIYKGFMVTECVIALSGAMRSRGRLLMANTAPVSSCLLSFHLDVMGTETNWKRGAWEPMADDDMMFRRAVCGAKPFCFLMNTDFTRFTHEDSERYMQRCLAYGMFPSFFSANAATEHYFSQPSLYERDRPLFKKYLPLVTMIAEAGWRPVNRLLAAEAKDVFAEQFGDCFVTVFNASSKNARRVRLVPSKAASAARELVAGESLTFPAEGAVVDLPPQTCRLFHFSNKQ